MPWRDWIPGLRPVQHMAEPINPADITSEAQPMIIRPGEYAPAIPPTQPVEQTPQQEPDLNLYGATGTPIVSGFVTELQEYNSDLRGRGALAVYEKMRRSDADVAAILAACKLPIRAADFQVVPGAKDNEPDFKLAEEIAEFVRESLFEDLEYENALGMHFSQRFESVIENALLCLDFGCSGHEDVWRIDGDKVRLARIAPRLPITFYRFHVDHDGETLRSVEQWGYRGDNFVTVAVPANKFTLFTLRKEGANLYGRSILREAYQHWFIKNGLYRVDSIACERNGAGIPTIVMGPNPSTEDKLAAEGWSHNISTHESTSLVLPHEWDFKLVATTGSVHPVIPSIQHHSEMIARSSLAMFMALGTTQSGSRALGNTMVDFFQLSEEATAKFICDTISETTIRRIVDFNYANTTRHIPYPRLIVPHIAVLNPIDIFDALQKISGATIDLVQPDDETENWIRKKVGMPLKNKARPRYAPVVQKVEEKADKVQFDTETKKGLLETVCKKCGEIRLTKDICIGSGGAITKGPGGFIGQQIHAVRAKLSYVPATKERQQIADEWQNRLAKTLGGHVTPNNAEVDIIRGKNGIELKTVQVSKKDRVEMRPDSRQRKEEWLKNSGMKGHTVAIDLRSGKPEIYYREGFGAFRFGQMEKLPSFAALKTKLK